MNTIVKTTGITTGITTGGTALSVVGASASEITTFVSATKIGAIASTFGAKGTAGATAITTGLKAVGLGSMSAGTVVIAGGIGLAIGLVFCFIKGLLD